METVGNIAKYLETFATNDLSEDYDNTGLLIGDPGQEVKNALIAFEITHEVIQEALSFDCQLIITHHPLIFKPLKKINRQIEDQRLVADLIRHGISHIALHTNADNIVHGVNKQLAKKLGLQDFKILKPGKDRLYSVVVFIPEEAFKRVEAAMFEAGAGHIGNYSHCGYSLSGTGSFLPLENAKPAIGEIHRLERVNERRLEVIVPGRKLRQVIAAMLEAHPYEEVAHFVIPLQNIDPESGAGGIGQLPEPMDYEDFAHVVKQALGLEFIRSSKQHPAVVKKVAFCGGSGAFLIPDARKSGADVFITGDVKYHDFFLADSSFGIIDAGHYETEIMIINEFAEFLKKKFNTFAVQISNVKTNPIITL
ncbi:GTP cyclohydrolase 1 type 2 [Thermaurantimonas aggregans]|uniref:GTP cyclohydrolase 1 type 2 homolog n=1 Tax=Thermaurantimonas aggregans TaxID=2173829 RepID=A0A401XKY4_9FLAO|nr:Nif3-like dinuclear metal center hexameric protein [Thermaurantimonas aggregans]MCX8148253.1 Nif3-like dinuclear metal center hexameric protein [Thermaurantimonas aggregans]GCD77679.1 GTP cyclohydrolase 1 type 2 [Thermaurantimonas aggregans]